MATNFPTSLDSFTDPVAGDNLNSPDHAGQHTDKNDAIEAIEAKVGIDNSAVTSSLDYKISRLPTYVLKTSDQTKNSDETTADDTQLYFTMDADSTYQFSFRIYYETSSAADMKFQLTGPASPDFIELKEEQRRPNSSTFSTNAFDGYITSDETLPGGDGAGILTLEGLIQNGSNSGDVKFRWAQNSSDASDTTVKKGSTVSYLKVA